MNIIVSLMAGWLSIANIRTMRGLLIRMKRAKETRSI